jgi:hypothetical protein
MKHSLVTSGVIVGIVLSCVGTSVVFGLTDSFGQ